VGWSATLAWIIGTLAPSLKYKRAYFVDWRIADRQKRKWFDRVDFFLDTNLPGEPKLVAGDAVRAGLKHATTRPFRVVPILRPGPVGRAVDEGGVRPGPQRRELRLVLRLRAGGEQPAAGVRPAPV
jgi:hypothetical protein